jgi:hypothetical protein
MSLATLSRRTSPSKLIDSLNPRYAHGIRPANEVDRRSVAAFMVVEQEALRKA